MTSYSKKEFDDHFGVAVILTKEDVVDKKKDDDDMPIGHQHYYMLNFDVGDRIVMFEA